MIFNKKKKETVKYDNCESYKNFIASLLVDKEVREEVLNEISYFEKNGYIYFEGNNLYGRSFEKESPLYLEIRYDQSGFICNYTKWSGRASIKITQGNLKQGNVKVEREEIGNCVSDTPHDHNETIESFKKIYDKNSKLIYEETYKEDRDYGSYETGLIYKDGCFRNTFELNRTWNISNGSIIQYKLTKNDFYSDATLQEDYLICEKPVKVPFEGTHYYFDNLNKELFKLFMTGEMTIENVLEEHKKEQAKKPKRKVYGGDLIIG